jgi:imidazoleglycerol-phosphate dehydratase
MSDTRAGVRLALATSGSGNVSTGLTVLDYLITALAKAARVSLTLEVSPGSADEAAGAAGRAFGAELRGLLGRGAGSGWALVPADEALASAALELDDEPRLVTNVDFSGQRVGGLSTDVASRFLRETAQEAGLNLHVRLLEGTDPQHVLTAIFKAVGAALGQACRPQPSSEEEEVA